MSRNGHISDNELHADPGIEIHAHAGRRVRTERDTRTVFEKGATGRRAFVCPEMDVPQVDGLLPERLRRSEPPALPELSEPEIVRHYVNLSKRNFDLDSGFYPLG